MTTLELRFGFWRNVAGTVTCFVLCLVGIIRCNTLLAAAAGFGVVVGLRSMTTKWRELKRRGEKLI